MGRAAPRLRDRIPRLDAGQTAPGRGVQGAQGRQACRGNRSGGTAEAIEAPNCARSPIGIHLTHPGKDSWEEAGITKQGLAEFYTDIADWILPHIAGRPLSLLRCPSGTGAKCFFAKHPWQGLDASVRRIDTGDKEPMVAVDELAGLMCLVQAGVVEIHPWGSTVDHLGTARSSDL